jgi:hypothetical protein
LGKEEIDDRNTTKVKFKLYLHLILIKRLKINFKVTCEVVLTVLIKERPLCFHMKEGIKASEVEEAHSSTDCSLFSVFES